MAGTTPGYHQSGSVDIALQLSRLQRSGLVDMDPWQEAGYHQSGLVKIVPQQGQLCRLQRSGLVDMDPWQAAGYHQSGSVEIALQLSSGLDWYTWIGGSQQDITSLGQLI